jgi:hypothetical protein
VLFPVKIKKISERVWGGGFRTPKVSAGCIEWEGQVGVGLTSATHAHTHTHTHKHTDSRTDHAAGSPG